MAVFNPCVSLLPKVRVGPTREVELMTFLLHTGKEYQEQIERIRSVEDKDDRRALKKELPAIIPAGVFRRYDGSDHLFALSGCLSVDLDHIQDVETAKMELGAFPGLVYCGLSVSGKGLFLIIRLARPELYLDQQRAVWEDLRRLGYEPDVQTCNLNRSRFVSYDPDPVVRFNPEPYEGILEEKKVEVCKAKEEPTRRTNKEWLSEAEKVERCIEQITSHGIDITADRRDWLRVAFALSGIFGETGREYFHEVSRFYPKYTRKESDRVYSDCLRRNNGRVGLGSFFSLCGDYGIRW